MINGAFPDIVTYWTSLDPLLCSVTESKYLALFDPERNSITTITTCQKKPSHLAAAPPDSELSLITPEIRFIPAVIFQDERGKKKAEGIGEC